MKKTFLFSILYLSLNLIHSQVNFKWAKQIGGAATDIGLSVATDPAGNIYSCGYFNYIADMDPGPAVYNFTTMVPSSTVSGSSDIYVSKLDINGNFIWAKQFGGTGADYGNSITIDGSGNLYMTGWFQDKADFDPGPGTYTLTSASANVQDVFICKLDPAGNLIWAKSFGGVAYDEADAITLDAAGNVYVTGTFESTVDFDPGPGVYNLTAQGVAEDVFVCKLDGSGNFIWAKKIGGSGMDFGNSITVDAAGNVFTCGTFEATADFDPGAATYTISSAGYGDGFICKLDASGNFVWAAAIKGSVTADACIGIKADVTGNVCIVGEFYGTVDFDPGPGNYSMSGAAQVFVLKLDNSGNFIWAGQIGSGRVHGIDLDPLGNIYFTGLYVGTIDLDPGTGTFFTTSTGTNPDLYIVKLDGSGNYVWGTSFGGANYEQSYCMDVDVFDNVITTGQFQGTADFDPGPSVYNMIVAGNSDAFVHKLCQSNCGLGIEEVIDDALVLFYPNPANSSFKLQTNAQLQNIELVLFNSLGQKVFDKKINNISDEIDIKAIARGLYTAILFSDHNKIYQGRIILE